MSYMYCRSYVSTVIFTSVAQYIVAISAVFPRYCVQKGFSQDHYWWRYTTSYRPSVRTTPASCRFRDISTCVSYTNVNTKWPEAVLEAFRRSALTSRAKTLHVILDTIFAANLSTAAKHPTIWTNHLADIGKTKHNCNQEQHKNLNSNIRKLHLIHDLLFLPISTIVATVR